MFNNELFMQLYMEAHLTAIFQLKQSQTIMHYNNYHIYSFISHLAYKPTSFPTAGNLAIISNLRISR